MMQSAFAGKPPVDCMLGPVILHLEKLRQEDCLKFEARLRYSPSWACKGKQSQWWYYIPREPKKFKDNLDMARTCLKWLLPLVASRDMGTERKQQNTNFRKDTVTSSV